MNILNITWIYNLDLNNKTVIQYSNKKVVCTKVSSQALDILNAAKKNLHCQIIILL